MATQVNHPDDLDRPRPAVIYGRDEMNLAEFPFATLLGRPDNRQAIVHTGWITDQDGSRHEQSWIVRGLSGLGLPTEFDERVYVALMAVTAQHGFRDRRVPFSIYKLLKILDQEPSQRHYESVERALDRLKGVTIKAEGAFFDNSRKEVVRTAMAFNIIDKYWLRYREQDERVREEEGVPAYIVWGEDIWKSFQGGYIKELDLAFFNALESPTARRLYRFLDKRMRYQDAYEIDIFELASRMGMARYAYPAHVKRKLQPAFDELIERGFLAAAATVHRQGYTRLRFCKVQEMAEEASGTVFDRLIEHGINPKKARQLASAYESDYIEEKIEFLEWKLSEGRRGRPISDPAAWLIRAIEKDFKPPVTFRSHVQLRADLLEQQALWEEIDQRRVKEREQQVAHQQGVLEQVYQIHGTTGREEDLWRQTLVEIKLRTTKATYLTWFASTHLLSLKDGVAVIGVPHAMAQDWLSQRATDLVQECLEQTAEGPATCRFEVIRLDD